jgi:hypothetical protein
MTEERYKIAEYLRDQLKNRYAVSYDLQGKQAFMDDLRQINLLGVEVGDHVGFYTDERQDDISLGLVVSIMLTEITVSTPKGNIDIAARDVICIPVKWYEVFDGNDLVSINSDVPLPLVPYQDRIELLKRNIKKSPDIIQIQIEKVVETFVGPVKNSMLIGYGSVLIQPFEVTKFSKHTTAFTIKGYEYTYAKSKYKPVHSHIKFGRDTVNMPIEVVLVIPYESKVNLYMFNNLI